MTPNDADIEIRLLSHPRNLCVVRGAVRAAFESAGFGQAACAQVVLAVDEALANVIRHGYEGREDGPIWVRLSACVENERSGLQVVIEDEGQQIDPEKICGRDLSDVRPGGLGVHIIRQVMDDVVYSKRPEAGMRLALTKWADATAAA